MRFIINKKTILNNEFINEFKANKQSFFKSPIIVSLKNDNFVVFDGAKRLMCLKNDFDSEILDFTNDLEAIKLIKPCIIYIGSKPYDTYEIAKIKHYKLLNELEEFLDNDDVYYFFANKKRVKRAEIFLNFLDTPDLLFKLKEIYKHKNPLVGYLYYRNIFKNTDNFYLFDKFILNDINSIKDVISNMHFHYQLDKLTYGKNPNKIKYILSLFNMIKDGVKFDYKVFKNTDYDLEHIKAIGDKGGNNDAWRNNLCNMLLLDKSTNRRYKNADFSKKAAYVNKQIKKHNKYYLYATRAVLANKAYGDTWDYEAASKYLIEIKQTLNFIWGDK